METSTPDPADRFTILRQELRLRFDAHGPMHGIEGVLRVLLFGLFMCLINLAASRAERGPQQRACRPGAGAQPERPEPERIDAPGDLAAAVEHAGTDHQGAAARSSAGRRLAVSAAAAAAGAQRVADGPADDGPANHGHAAAMARTVSALHYASRVVQVPFAKTRLPERRGIVSISFRYRNKRKNRLMSAASSAGCSIAAKWPPRGIFVHCRTSKKRSTRSRGGHGISTGNCAKPSGGCTR